MERGDIYLVILNPDAEPEQHKKQLVFILSPRDFNEITQTPIVLPMSIGDGLHRNVGFVAEVVGKKLSGVVRCDQPCSLDFSKRSAQKLDHAKAEVIDDVLARFKAIFHSEIN
ncbi:MAG: type II toxin-antitoxin system PemK/MazF family toxin [Acinetobacter sp.]